MKKVINVFILFLCTSLFGVSLSKAASVVHLYGTLQEPANVDITVITFNEGKIGTSQQYSLRKGERNFSFVASYDKNTTYKMRITLLKQGHMRLEKDKDCNITLDLQNKQFVNIAVKPSLFDEAGSAKGVTITNEAAGKKYISIDGKLESLAFKFWSISLLKVNEGATELLQSTQSSNGDSSVHFLLPEVKEGIYYLVAPRWSRKIYLKPQVSTYTFNLDNKTGDINWDNGIAENNILSQWDKLLSPITNYVANRQLYLKNSNINLDSFTTAYQQLQIQVTQFLSEHTTGNAKFNTLFPIAAQTDNNLVAMQLLYNGVIAKVKGYGGKPKFYAAAPAYYQQIFKQNAINNTNLLKVGEGIEYLRLLGKCSLAFLPEARRMNLSNGEMLQTMLQSIENDTLKSYLLKDQMHEIDVINYSEFRSVFYPQRKYAFLPAVKRDYDNMFQLYSADTAYIGHSSYNFTLPDVDGKMVSMKDFKGKVVLVDVWATWCGPCLGQIPFLKEIEEAYKDNNNIVFAGISLDFPGQVEKWKKYVADKKLAGVQLIDGKSDFAHKYNMRAIPRFMLIDRKGNWIEVRCPLPEDKERFKRMLDTALAN